MLIQSSWKWLWLVVVMIIFLCGQLTLSEPQRTTTNQRQQQQAWQRQEPSTGGLRRSFSTGNLDQLSERRRKPDNKCNLNYDFDYFVLAIQWPLSFCAEKLQCDLKIAQRKKWLIHGLWPNRDPRKALGRNPRDLTPSSHFGGSEPNLLGSFDNAEFCCGPKYNSSMISGTLYRELLDKWPTLNTGGRHHSFWQHEWQKHGTCSRQVRPLQTQSKYFETVLGLYNRFDLNKVPLQSGKSYSIQELHRMIEPRVGNYKVRLECSLIDDLGANGQPQTSLGSSNRKPPSERKSIFLEVHICLDKQLRPMDCTRRDDYQCKRSIYFP